MNFLRTTVVKVLLYVVGGFKQNTNMCCAMCQQLKIWSRSVRDPFRVQANREDKNYCKEMNQPSMNFNTVIAIVLNHKRTDPV